MKSFKTYQFTAIVSLVFIFILRGLWAFFTELTEDEAYYYTWSNQLDFGYFDHGPFTAYLIKAGTAIFGYSEVAVRSGAIFCGILTTFFIYLIGKNLTKDVKKSLFIVIIINVIPSFSVGSSIITPDSPFMLFLSIWLYLLLSINNLFFDCKSNEIKEKSFAIAGLVSGLVMGLGMASKYTMILALPAVLPIILHLRRQNLIKINSFIFFKMFLSFTFGFFAVFGWVITWNIEHNFASLLFQFNHGFGGTFSLKPLHFLESLSSIFALLTPVPGVIVIVYLTKLQKENNKTSEIVRYCVLPAILFFLLLSMVKRIEMNWTAPFIALGLLGSIQIYKENASGYIKQLFKWSIPTAFLLTFIAHSYMLYPFLPLKPGADPAERFSGSKNFASSVVSVVKNTVQDNNLNINENNNFKNILIKQSLIYTLRYQEAALLNYYGNLNTHAIGPGWRKSQYDIWKPPKQNEKTIKFLLGRQGVLELHKAADKMKCVKLNNEIKRNSIIYDFYKCF